MKPFCNTKDNNPGSEDGCSSLIATSFVGGIVGYFSGGIMGSLIEHAVAHITGDPYAIIGLDDACAQASGVLSAIVTPLLSYRAYHKDRRS